MSKKAGVYMNNKKAICILIFVLLLILFCAIKFIKEQQISDIPELETQQEVVIEEKTFVDENRADKDKEVKIQVESNHEKVLLKKDSIKPETPVIKPLKVEEPQSVVNEVKTDEGIVKEPVSNEIIINKEFKLQSPAKYSFVGYGEQVAPTK